jgi:hypothetical protein
MSDIGFVELFTTLVMIFAAVIAAYVAVILAIALLITVVELVRYPFAAKERTQRRALVDERERFYADMAAIDRAYRDAAPEWQPRPIGVLHGVEVIPRSREEQVVIQCMEDFTPYRMDA